ncbi:hypothetical protein PVK06_018715 [Gossypium arboreum]|uniref:Uncharacterized protein n=1 Tax=Gossypium arboreum TaxID=29729 RepID=A0ABR0PHQ7_GOSAR|nr:hypothetical protein PVK06_018715 [Gossypium arboreum]
MLVCGQTCVTYESDVSSHLQAPFVLCRVFAKPRFGNTVFENLDDPIATRAVSVGSFEFHSGILPDLRNDPVRSRLTTGQVTVSCRRRVHI